MLQEHYLGPELGSKPTTYTCACGFRNTDYGDVSRHIAEGEGAARGGALSTIIRADGAAEIEVASTPYGDDVDAVEIRLVLRDIREGQFRRHMVLVARSSLDFLIDQLEVHRLGKDRDPCDACAAQAFIARLTDASRHVEHTCPEPTPHTPEPL
jgi:hypothetical protein